MIIEFSYIDIQTTLIEQSLLLNTLIKQSVHKTKYRKRRRFGLAN